MRAAWLVVALLLMSCNRRDVPVLPPLPEPPGHVPVWKCPEMVAGDYFWRGGVAKYPPYMKQVRIFWRDGIPVVPCVTRGILGIPWECVPARYVIVHHYGGCGPRDEACMLRVLDKLQAAGVRYVEIANEQGAECGSCLAVQARVRDEAKRRGFIVYANIEPPTSDAAREWLPHVDRLAAHGLLPWDVDRIPDWLWLSGKLEISSDAQHCEDLGCAHVDSAELLEAIVARLQRQPAYVTTEWDFFDNGSLGAHPGDPDGWIPGEWQEFEQTVRRLCVE